MEAIVLGAGNILYCNEEDSRLQLAPNLRASALIWQHRPDLVSLRPIINGNAILTTLTETGDSQPLDPGDYDDSFLHESFKSKRS